MWKWGMLLFDVFKISESKLPCAAVGFYRFFIKVKKTLCHMYNMQDNNRRIGQSISTTCYVCIQKISLSRIAISYFTAEVTLCKWCWLLMLDKQTAFANLKHQKEDIGKKILENISRLAKFHSKETFESLNND